MANAPLYYRTTTTPVTNNSYADPDNLPAAQKLLFTPPNDLLSGIDEHYKNNIVRKIPPKSGARKIIQTDEGFAGWLITISGNYIVLSGASATKLHAFRKLVQLDTTHKFGIFGIKYPNGPSYLNIDPTTTKGLMIDSTQGKH